MAAVAPPAPAAANLKAKPIIREKIRVSNPTTHPSFDAAKHLSFKEPPKTLSTKDLGLPDNVGISPIAVSDPFPLFTEEAINIMREEIFSAKVWDECIQSSAFASCQLRAHCPKYAPFMYNAWKDPKTLSIISSIAGIDVIPVMDLEVGNINISVSDPEDAKAKKETMDDDIPVTQWHVDSYPLVCIVMMSDTTNMIGGETKLQTGTGEIMKVRGPEMGCAVILQGRYIRHQALAAIGGTERITMVTPFRPRDPLVPDDSVLTTIRPITPLSELYFQWTQYRVEVLQKRLQEMIKVLEEQHRADQPTDVKRIKGFLKQQEEWLACTNREILE